MEFMPYPSGDRDASSWMDTCAFRDGDDPNDFVQSGLDLRRKCGYCAQVQRLPYADAYDVEVGSGHRFCVSDRPGGLDRDTDTGEYDQSCVIFTARSAEI